jgi:hypothetical protein
MKKAITKNILTVILLALLLTITNMALYPLVLIGSILEGIYGNNKYLKL